MAWSYSGDPASSLKDQVRFLAQDTDTNLQFVQDEEINWLLTQTATLVGGVTTQRPYTAAAHVAFQILQRATRWLDTEVGDVRVQRSRATRGELETVWRELCVQARAREGAADTDLLPDNIDSEGPDNDLPYYSSGMMDNPRAGDAPDDPNRTWWWAETGDNPGLFPTIP